MTTLLLCALLAGAAPAKPSLGDLYKFIPLSIDRFELEAVAESRAGATAGQYVRGELMGIEAVYVFKAGIGPVFDGKGFAIPIGSSPDLLKCPERHHLGKPLVLTLSLTNEPPMPCGGSGFSQVLRSGKWCGSVARNDRVPPGRAAYEVYWDLPGITVLLSLGGPGARLKDAQGAIGGAARAAGIWMTQVQAGTARVDWTAHASALSGAISRFKSAPDSPQLCSLGLE